MSAERRVRTQVLGVSIDAVALEPSVERIAAWAARGESRYVCLCDAHLVVTRAAAEPAWERPLLENSDESFRT